LNNASGLNLNNATTVASVLNLLSGNLTLGTNNLTITNTASGAITGSFSNSNMIIADNTGQLVRATVTGTSYIYPIGDATGSLDYSPVSINFSAKSAASNIGFRVVDAVHPSINAASVQVDYISRYWISSNSSSPTYTYTATFDYVSSDINGSAANISINKWDGSIWTQAILSQSVANQLSLVTSETHTRMSFSSTAEFTGRVKPGEIYTWNQTGTADYTVPANWTPTRTTPLSNDVLQFNNGATTTATNVPTEAIAQLFVTNNTNVSLTSATTSTLSIINGNGADLQVSTGSSINIASSNVSYAHEPMRERKLLMKKKELRKLENELINGLTIVPYKLYRNETGLIKMEIVLAKGKKLWDKRDSIKERDINRELKRGL
jgi:hypothetical protein